MNANDLTTIDQVCAFMSGTQRVVFEVAGDKQGRYDWVRRTLVKFDYSGCGKADRGVLISYLMKVSSYSRAQVKRLIKRYRETGRLTPRQRVNRKLKCPLFRMLKCPLVDKEMAVSIILCISPYLATVPVSLQAHVPTTPPCASLSTGNSPP